MKSLLDRMITAGFSTPERQRGIYFADDLKEIRRIIEERP